MVFYIFTFSEIECPELHAPKHGKIQQQRRKYLSNVTIVCDEGFIYTKPDFIVRRCQRNRAWSGQEGECEGWFCHRLDYVLIVND